MQERQADHPRPVQPGRENGNSRVIIRVAATSVVSRDSHFTWYVVMLGGRAEHNKVLNVSRL